MKTRRASLKFFAALALGFLAGGWLRADNVTPGFQGDGFCRFALQQYVLPKANEEKINFIVGDLLKRHEAAFNFTANPELHVRLRIFGSFEGYKTFALTNHIGFEHESISISNLAGYYSGRNNEVVTWRQRDPTYLANNILHECSHAILHQQFRALPIWLDEGGAVYFSFPAYMRDAADDRRLRSQWFELKKWLDEKSLPDLRGFLNISPPEFRRQPAAKMYPVSWSVFQLLMATPENRQALNALVVEFQKPDAPPDCAKLLDKFYPGGLGKMEKDWRVWIARGAAGVLGTR